MNLAPARELESHGRNALHHRVRSDPGSDAQRRSQSTMPLPAMRPVELLYPPPDSVRSGGNVYNEKLAEAAALCRFPLSLRVVLKSEIGARLREKAAPFQLWDSLFLAALADCESRALADWGLLLHYLPSHDPTLARTERARLAAVEARVIESARLIIVTGRHLKKHVERMRHAGPVFVCEPGVSSEFLTTPHRHRITARETVELLTVANLLPGKGLLEVLSVLAKLNHVSWRWHVIGDRTCDAVYTGRFEAEARRVGMQDRIVRHGSLDHAAIVDVMDRSDLFVFGSRYEAYGMALAEAAARCLPAVSTAVGAAAELYRHGTTGFTAALRDVRSFRMYLESLMSDSALRQRFRDNLRVHEPRTWIDTLGDLAAAFSEVNAAR